MARVAARRLLDIVSWRRQARRRGLARLTGTVAADPRARLHPRDIVSVRRLRGDFGGMIDVATDAHDFVIHTYDGGSVRVAAAEAAALARLRAPTEQLRLSVGDRVEVIGVLHTELDAHAPAAQPRALPFVRTIAAAHGTLLAIRRAAG